jgi:putative ABC transport system ATP-binding protein
VSAYLLKFKDVKSEVSLENMESDHSINFELKHGEIGVILGQKEAHQIFQLILKKDNLKQGEIKFSDASLQKEWNKAEDIEWRQKIGFTFRDGGLLSNMTALENVDLPARYHGYYQKGSDEKYLAVSVLREVGVEEKYWNRRPSDIPDKILKEILLARSVILDPQILLLDDPSEYYSWVELPELFKWIKKQNKKRGIILGTQYIPLGLALASWILEEESFSMRYDFKNFLEKSWMKQAQNLIEFLEME